MKKFEIEMWGSEFLDYLSKTSSHRVPGVKVAKLFVGTIFDRDTKQKIVTFKRLKNVPLFLVRNRYFLLRLNSTTLLSHPTPDVLLIRTCIFQFLHRLLVLSTTFVEFEA